MEYDEDDEAKIQQAMEEMAPIDALVDAMLSPMIEAFLRMRFGTDDEDIPTWELSAEGAHVGKIVAEIMARIEDEQVTDVLFTALGRLAALSVRYSYVMSELQRLESEGPQ